MDVRTVMGDDPEIGAKAVLKRYGRSHAPNSTLNGDVCSGSGV